MGLVGGWVDDAEETCREEGSLLQDCGKEVVGWLLYQIKVRE